MKLDSHEYHLDSLYSDVPFNLTLKEWQAGSGTIREIVQIQASLAVGDYILELQVEFIGTPPRE